MKTSDLIALYRTVTDITNLVGQKIHNAKVPTKDAVTGEVDVPFIWCRFRNDMNWNCQNPPVGDQPMGKMFDVECVSDTMDQAEAVRSAVYSTMGFSGAAGNAKMVLVTIEDQADDYAVRSAPDDSGLFICSLLVQVIGV